MMATARPARAKPLPAISAPVGPMSSMRNPAIADPAAAPMSWPVPIHPNASAVSLNYTLADVIA